MTFEQELNTIDLTALNYPMICPHCQTPTVIDDSFPFCPNYDCSGRVYGRVLKYVEALDIKGVGEETIRMLVDRGIIKHPADLYEVDLATYCQLDRKGAKSYQKLLDGLRAKQTLDFYEFLGALSLDEAAVGTCLALAKAGFDTIEKVLNATPAQLARAERMTERKALRTQNSLSRQLDAVRRMIDNGYVKFRTITKESAIRGKTVAITGTLSHPRTHYENLLKEAGAFLGSSVTTKTHYLVCADPNGSSSKLRDARAKGVKVIGETDLTTLLN